MSCPNGEMLANGYIDGELDLTQALSFEKHLESCTECRALYERHQQLRRLMQQPGVYYEVPDDLRTRVADHVRPPDSAGKKRGARGPGMQWRLYASLASGAAVAVFAVLFFQLKGPSSEELVARQVVSSHVRSLMADHLADIASSDQHTVKPWFNGKLDFAPVVKDLKAEGFPLAAGRLDYLADRPVAALVYKRRQHTINLFLWPSAESDSAPKLVSIRGYNVMHWTMASMTYWAVSDLNAGELKQFVRDEER
jgi:anti-sigma factor RsiW